MRKVTLTLIAAGLLAGCSAKHSVPVSVHAHAHASLSPAPRKPLSLELGGVKFDTLTRAQAVQQLEARGFKPLRVSIRYACDNFSPAPAAHAKTFVACWYRGRWAEARLDLRTRAGLFRAALSALTRRYGTHGKFWLPRFPLPGAPAKLAEWFPAGGRGRVRLVEHQVVHPGVDLSIADSRERAALLASGQRQAAARRASHPARSPARISPPRPSARTSVARQRAGIPSVKQALHPPGFSAFKEHF